MPLPAWNSSPAAPHDVGLHSVFGGTGGSRQSSPLSSVPHDDLFGGFPGVGSSSGAPRTTGGDDIFGPFSSSSDDLLGGFGGIERGSDAKGKSCGSNDLLGDFGGIGSGSNSKLDGDDPFGGFGRGSGAKGKKFDGDSDATAFSDDLLGGFRGIKIGSDVKGRKSEGGNNATSVGEDLLGGFGTSGRGSNVNGRKSEGGDYATSAGDDLLGGFGGSGRASEVKEKKVDEDGYAASTSEDLLGGFGEIGNGSKGAKEKLEGNRYATTMSEDLLGGFGGVEGGTKVKGDKADGDLVGNDVSALDELLPGFAGDGPPRAYPSFDSNKSSAYEKSTTSIPKDPFLDLESTVPAYHSSGSFVNTFEEFNVFSGNTKSEKSSRSVFDDGSIFENFVGSVPISTSEVKTSSRSVPISASEVKTSGRPFTFEGSTSIKSPTGLDGSSDVDFMFVQTKKKHDPLVDLVTKPSNLVRPPSGNRLHAQPVKSDQQGGRSVKHVESADNIWFSNSETTVLSQSSASSSNIRRASSSPNILDDWNSLFAAPSSGEFQEIEGEPEERRRARLERHRRTLERAAKALVDKNERDLQIERESAERHRIAERLDADIKRWAAGKEGNLRALLSSLQHILWPECGWQPVTLTDLITSASVKKVYRKATLCIHPDKVQQKGANVQQKYTAEKVFDLLKEAWKKFNTEELS